MRSPSARSGKARWLGFIAVSWGCVSCGNDHPCEGFVARCEGNVAVRCVEESECDQCGYRRVIESQDCSEEGAFLGVEKVCRVKGGGGSSSAICVDAALTTCAESDPTQNWCDDLGNMARCLQTIDGAFVSSERCGRELVGGRRVFHGVCIPLGPGVGMCVDDPLVACGPPYDLCECRASDLPDSVAEVRCLSNGNGAGYEWTIYRDKDSCLCRSGVP